ncbi:hypothetical protein NM208_g3799 [Fusarium decemcellulare]|uniref:Uncharacterized protein n=1 Tax=Fusarium decemcellulare TaxID=57161 RepID=A0ACC1SMT8_9HYPO|nr:hypothetical protein NM208_g3799 [Fusarium decemcellulare]
MPSMRVVNTNGWQCREAHLRVPACEPSLFICLKNSSPRTIINILLCTTAKTPTEYKSKIQRSYQHSYRRPDPPRGGEGGHEQNGMAAQGNGTILADNLTGSGVSEDSTPIPPVYQAWGQSRAFGTAHPQERNQAAGTQQPEESSRQGGGPSGSKEVPDDSGGKGPARRLIIIERAVSAVYGIRRLDQWFLKVENPVAGGPQNDFIARVPNQWNMCVGKCSCEEVIREMYNLVMGMVPGTGLLYYMMLPDGEGRPEVPISVLLWTNPMAELGIAAYPS